MSKKMLIWLASLGGVAILSYSAYRYITQQIVLLEASCYKFKNFKFLTLKKDKIAISINMYVKNLSKIGFILKNYDFDIILNDRKVANVNKQLNQHISANGEVSMIGINFEFNPRDIFDMAYIVKLLRFALFDNSKFILKIKGFVDVKHSFIQTKQDIDIVFTLKEILEDDNEATSVNKSPECIINV